MVLSLLALLVWPVLANNRPQSRQLACFANLRQVGIGYGIWAADHGDLFPFFVPMEAGGIAAPYRGDSIQANGWFQFSWISNELQTPKVLACPADSGKRVATNFNSLPGGFIHPDYQNSALSYTVSYPGGLAGHSVLSGDRNVASDGMKPGCSVFGIASGFQAGWPHAQTRWMPGGPHGEFGNLLLRDGSVEFTGTPEMQRCYDLWVNDAGQIHFLHP